jgi:Family of unknown function (DUF6084)
VVELTFEIRGAEAVEYAVTPTLVFKLEVEAAGGDAPTPAIRSISLSTQVRIAANLRPYSAREQQRLTGTFGDPQQWSTSLQSLLWAHSTLVIPPFEGSTQVDLPVVCTYDFEVATARYFQALEGGTVPVLFLFSGSVFYATTGGLQVARIGWDREARFSMQVSLWQQAVDYAFPNSAWLRLPRATFDRLADYRSRRALPTWEAALDSLLEDEEVASR